VSKKRSPREATVEEHLRERVERAGGWCVKLNAMMYKGIPDRLVILPNGVLFFAELKRPRGGVWSTLQQWWHSRLNRHGHDARVLHTKKDVDEVLAEYGF